MSARTGPTFAMFLKKELTPFVYVKYQAAYITKGNSSPNNTLWTYNLEYITIPVQFGVQPINSYNVSKNVQLGIEGGLAVNYALGGLNNISNAYSSANNAKVNRLALSMPVGLNFEYRLSPKRILFFNITWYHDLTPLLSYESGNATYKATNQGWMFTTGIMFPRNK